MPTAIPRSVAAVLAIWFTAALVTSVTGWFARTTPPIVALTVWTLVLACLLAARLWRPAREWIGGLPMQLLIGIHIIRFVGFWFLWLAAHNRLSPSFAVPAGWGDITVATGAVILLVSGAASSTKLTRLWNLLGIADLLFVVMTALRVGLRDPAGMAALRQFPLSLLPEFLVPLLLASHVWMLTRDYPHYKSNMGQDGIRDSKR